ncbi:SMU1112c/YaeR family gloxylase I-like metalloprotein [Loigolactobacillus iwatensis]|uniref:SMU1112c/YaeR family gloxylase I-like metalloprotein n=1 Tax=Loigolactobacillus iwatensis TaxID=1267156 RepID=UPI000F7EC2A2|nr:VOC family protein [Loigolactobacillus iwatensis]
MHFQQIHHIAIIGSDYAQTKKFYVDQLGFQVLADHKRETDRKLDLTNGEIELEIFIKANSPARPSYPEALGLRHLAFKVASVAETSVWLNNQGIKTEPIRNDAFTNKAMTFFFDPDGLPLEIHE